MFTLRPSAERGSANHGWLETRYSFSFSSYYDPQHMGFSALRVINDDMIHGGKGFDTHSHKDMEIITWVLEGDIAHKDNQGNVRTLPAGEFQLMSAGSGIAHSEYNHSNDNVLKLLQIWIEPNQKGTKPGYQQRDFDQQLGLTHIISPNGENNTLLIKQDMHLYQLILDSGTRQEMSTHLPNQYIQLVSGELEVNGVEMLAGDGVKINGESTLIFNATGDKQTKALLFELP